jgi:hypothetical protein
MKTRVFAVCAVVFLFCANAQADLKDGLVAYYPFNGNANDESGNGNNGIVYGATLTTDRFGNANHAYSFDGISNYIIVTDGSQFNFSNILSVSLWVKPKSTQVAHAALIDKSHSHGSNGWIQKSWAIQQTENDTNVYYFNFQNNNTAFYNNRFSLEQNIWTHVFIVKENNIIKIYINNKLIATSVEGSVNIDTNGDKPLLIGSINNTIGSVKSTDRHFNGMIDDIRIYNRVLSDSEIQAIYNEGQVCSDVAIKPYTFSAATPAKASEVNANFDTIYDQHNCQIQALKAQVQALKQIVCQDQPTADVCK